MPKLSEQFGNTPSRHTKETKAEANYKGHTSHEYSDGPTDHCGSCKYYEPDEHHSSVGTCDIVAGSISFSAVCDHYAHRVTGDSVDTTESSSGGSSSSSSSPTTSSEAEPA